MKKLLVLAALAALIATPTLAIDGISFGTTTEEPAETEAAPAAPNVGNGVNDVDIQYDSNIVAEEGAYLGFKGATDAPETIKALNNPKIARYETMGLVYAKGQKAIQDRYKDISGKGVDVINATIKENSQMAKALIVAASDPSVPQARVDRMLESADGYSLANAYLNTLLGETEVIEKAPEPSLFPSEENHGLDIADIIVFAGAVILLWILGGKLAEWAKTKKADHLAKKKARQAEEEAMREALREKNAREAAQPRRRNRTRNRGTATENTEGTPPSGEAQEA